MSIKWLSVRKETKSLYSDEFMSGRDKIQYRYLLEYGNR